MTDRADFTCDFSGKTVLVTGSSRGIGRGIATSFARAGARVFVHGRSQASAQSGADTLLGEVAAAKVSALGFEVTDTAAIDRAMARIEAQAGGLDILISNAGFQNRTPVEDLDVETFRGMLEGNLVSHFSLAKAAARTMVDNGGGRIIVMASILALHGRSGLAGYCSSKSGLAGLVRVLACEFAGRGIRVNGIGPGFIATDMTADVKAQEGFCEQVIARTPARRWGNPADIAGPTLFLASDAADFVHGQILYVDGGLTASF